MGYKQNDQQPERSALPDNERQEIRPRLSDSRILIYSHDSFGLGHLRRCRTIAHSLVEHYKGVSVLILSGSPIIGSFDFRARVDFVRIPGVIKLYNGEYTSLGLHIDLQHTLEMRSSIIRYTTETFKPDLFLVDKEPLGLNGEVLQTLEIARAGGAAVVLGLRDVMDDPELLRREWRRKNVLQALENLYDEIWVYGLPEMGDPMAGIPVPAAIRDKTVYTGYLRRHIPQRRTPLPVEQGVPYILATAGGGGDGEVMIDWVMRACEAGPSIPYDVVVVLGPFMHPEQRLEFELRAERLDRVHVIEFDNQVETLMKEAVGVVAMGGYNTFCEILTLNKRALLVPRSRPRREQTLRAERAQQLGLARMVSAENGRETRVMAQALRDLPHQTPPSEALIPGMLDGLDVVNQRVEQFISGAGVPSTESVGSGSW